MALIEEVSALSEKFYSIDATNYEEDVENVYKRLRENRQKAEAERLSTLEVVLLSLIHI